MLSLHPDLVGVSESHVIRLAHESKDFAACTDTVFNKLPWGEGGQRGFLRRRLADLVGPLLFWRPRRLATREKPTTLHDLGYRDQSRLKEMLLASTSPEDYCRRFFGFLFDRLRPGRYLVEKTPTNIFEVPKIRRIFPEAKLVAIYRDGRDVVVSDKHYRRNQGLTSYSVEDSINKWRRAMEAQLEYAQAYDVLTFSYESLLADTADMLRRLLAFLEIPEDRAIQEDMLRRSSFEFTTGRARGQESTNNFYRKGVAGDWVEQLRDEDKALFAERAGDLLVRLGYEESADWREWGKVPTSRTVGS
jgi:hypothetical protein